MSASPQPVSHSPKSSAPGVTVPILMLALVLAVATTAAVIFAVLYFHGAAPAGGGNAGSAASTFDEPMAQQGAVSPGTKFSGVVYYEIPYTSPPSLKLTAAKRQYDILVQDEIGFTWAARPMWDDFTDDAKKKAETFKLDTSPDKLAANLSNLTVSNVFKPDLHYEDFTWEARGLRLPKGAPVMRVLPQQGRFYAITGQEGEVGFEIPYATSPNVELSSGLQVHNVVIVECRPTGFKWKKVGLGTDDGDVTWKAKGVRATELPKGK